MEKVDNNGRTDKSFSDEEHQNECKEQDGVLTMITTHKDTLYKTEIILNELICNEADICRTSNVKSILKPINEDSESIRTDDDQECKIARDDVTIILRASYKTIPDGCEYISSSEDEKVSCNRMEHVNRKAIQTSSKIRNDELSQKNKSLVTRQLHNQSHFKDSPIEAKKRDSKYSKSTFKSYKKLDTYDNIKIPIEQSEDEESSSSIYTFEKSFEMHDDRKSIASNEKSSSQLISVKNGSYGNGLSKGTLEGLVISIPKEEKDKISKSSMMNQQYQNTSYFAPSTRDVINQSLQKQKLNENLSKSSKNVREGSSNGKSKSKRKEKYSDQSEQEPQQTMTEKDVMSTNKSSKTKQTQLSETNAVQDSKVSREKLQDISEKSSEQSILEQSEKSSILDTMISENESGTSIDESSKKKKASLKSKSSSKDDREGSSNGKFKRKEKYSDQSDQESQQTKTEKDVMSTNKSSKTKRTKLSETNSVQNSKLTKEKDQDISEQSSEQSILEQSEKSSILDTMISENESGTSIDESPKKKKPSIRSSKSSKNVREGSSNGKSKRKEKYSDQSDQESLQNKTEKDVMSMNKSSKTKRTQLSEIDYIQDSKLSKEKDQDISEKSSEQSILEQSEKSSIFDAMISENESGTSIDESPKKKRASLKSKSSSKDDREGSSNGKFKRKEKYSDQSDQESQQTKTEKDVMSTNKSSKTKRTKLSETNSIQNSKLTKEKDQDIYEKSSEQSILEQSEKSSILDTMISENESGTSIDESPKKKRASLKSKSSSKKDREGSSNGKSKRKEKYSNQFDQEPQQTMTEKDVMSTNKSSKTKRTQLSESDYIQDSKLSKEKDQDISEKSSEQSIIEQSKKSSILDTKKSGRKASKCTGESLESKETSVISNKSSKNVREISSNGKSKRKEKYSDQSDQEPQQTMTEKDVMSTNKSSKTKRTQLSETNAVQDSKVSREKLEDISEKSSEQSILEQSKKSSILDTKKSGRKASKCTGESLESKETSVISNKSSKNVREISSNGKSKRKEKYSDQSDQEPQQTMTEKDVMSTNKSSKTKRTQLSETNAVQDSKVSREKLEDISEKSSEQSILEQSKKSSILDTKKSGRKASKCTGESLESKETSVISNKSSKNVREISSNGKSKRKEKYSDQSEQEPQQTMTEKDVMSTNKSSKTKQTQLSETNAVQDSKVSREKLEDISEKSSEQSILEQSQKSSILDTKKSGRKASKCTGESLESKETSVKSNKLSKNVREGSSNGKSKSKRKEKYSDQSDQEPQQTMTEKDVMSTNKSSKTKRTQLSETNAVQDSKVSREKLQDISEKSSEQSILEQSKKSSILDTKKSGRKASKCTGESLESKETSVKSNKSSKNVREGSSNGKSKTNATNATTEKSNNTKKIDTKKKKSFSTTKTSSLQTSSTNYADKIYQKSNPSCSEKKSENESIELTKSEVSSRDSISSLNIQDSIDDLISKNNSHNQSYHRSDLSIEDKELDKDLNGRSSMLSYLEINSDKENTGLSSIVASIKNSNSCFEEDTIERLEQSELVEVSKIETCESYEDQSEIRNLKQIDTDSVSNRESNPPSDDSLLSIKKLDDTDNKTILSVEKINHSIDDKKQTDYFDEQLEKGLTNRELKVKTSDDLHEYNSNSPSSNCESSSNDSTSETVESEPSSNKSTSKATENESSSIKSDSETTDSESPRNNYISKSKMTNSELSNHDSNSCDTKECSSDRDSHLSSTKSHLSDKGDSNPYLGQLDTNTGISKSKKSLPANKVHGASVNKKYDSTKKKSKSTARSSTSAHEFSSDFEKSSSNQSLDYKNSSNKFKNKLLQDRNKFESNRSVHNKNSKSSTDKEKSEPSPNIKTSDSKYFSTSSKASIRNKTNAKTYIENSTKINSLSETHSSTEINNYSGKSNRRDKKTYSLNEMFDKSKNQDSESNRQSSIDEKLSNSTQRSILFPKDNQPLEYWLQSTSSATSNQISSTSSKILKGKKYNTETSRLNSKVITPERSSVNILSSELLRNDDNQSQSHIDLSSKIEDSPQQYETSNSAWSRSPNNLPTSESIFQNKVEMAQDLESRKTPSSTLFSGKLLSINDKPHVTSSEMTPHTEESTSAKGNKVGVDTYSDAQNVLFTPGDNSSFLRAQDLVNDMMTTVKSVLEDRVANCDIDDILAKIFVNDAKNKIIDVPNVPHNDVVNYLAVEDSMMDKNNLEKLIVDENDGDKSEISTSVIKEHHSNSSKNLPPQNILIEQSFSQEKKSEDLSINSDELLKQEFVTIMKNPNDSSSHTTSVNQLPSSASLTTHQMDKSTSNQSPNSVENIKKSKPLNTNNISNRSDLLDEAFSEENIEYIPKDKTSETVTSLLVGGGSLPLNISNASLNEVAMDDRKSYRSHSYRPMMPLDNFEQEYGQTHRIDTVTLTDKVHSHKQSNYSRQSVSDGSSKSKSNTVNADNSEEALIHRSNNDSFGRTHIHLEEDPCRTDNSGIVVDYQDIRNEHPEKVIDIRLGYLRARHVYEIVVNLSIDQIEVDVKDTTFGKQCEQLASIIQKDDTSVCCVFYLESDHDENLERCLAINVKDLQTEEITDNYSIIFHAQVIDMKR